MIPSDRGGTVNKQLFFPKQADMGAHNTVTIRTMGLDHPEGTYYRGGRDWQRHQVLRHEQIMVNVLEGYQSSGLIAYTHQEDYVKFNFWLGGKHTTVLDGFGQQDHDCPELFITAGPWEMVKADLHGCGARLASVALCVKRDFFPTYLGIDTEELPEPLSTVLEPKVPSYAFHRFALSPDLIGATRSILAAPAAVRTEPLYIQAKAIELMYLMLQRIRSAGGRTRAGAASRHESRLYDARQFLTTHFAQALSLEKICREVGLNRMALTGGFRRLFGMSVYEYLLQIRMERAYELLQDGPHSIGQVGEAVGYRHACNFSTAFHAFYGCTPQSVRQLASAPEE